MQHFQGEGPVATALVQKPQRVHGRPVGGVDLQGGLVGVDGAVGAAQLVAEDVAHLDVEVRLFLHVGRELDVPFQHGHQVLPAPLGQPQTFERLDGLQVGGVEGEDAFHAGVGVGGVLVGVLPDGGGAEEDVHLGPVVLGHLELPLVDGEQVGRSCEARV